MDVKIDWNSIIREGGAVLVVMWFRVEGQSSGSVSSVGAKCSRVDFDGILGIAIKLFRRGAKEVGPTGTYPL